ncbi:Fe-S cluster biogenesis protein NfuA, 4Fe-4S-binding domain [Singulisphaera sp. GP187]|uniref:NifU family protein n=1 Tax=Singulisphaera sp. GP187 TaxID=1882752 RepID=UPI0009299578|nr:NifU family protein [Singulisphaera sp. GP187]SIO28790.1 Fe-S cluster biogenesis protein NfuA, 4Fe-4S-binding domain [Singulisphaera sp. GP187]
MPEIAITAEPLTGPRCVFLVSRPIAPNQWAYAADLNSAQGSPLVEALFAVEGVSAVLVAHDLLVVTRSGDPGLPLVGPYVRLVRRVLGDPSARAPVDWKTLGKGVAKVLRSHLDSGQVAFAPALIASMPTTEQLRQRVRDVLEEQVNPVVASHGGGVDLVDLIDNVVYLRMSGGCQGCGLADVTLRHGVDAVIREAVPEIGRIHDLTNHAAGARPYQARGSSPFVIKK